MGFELGLWMGGMLAGLALYWLASRIFSRWGPDPAEGEVPSPSLPPEGSAWQTYTRRSPVQALQDMSSLLVGQRGLKNMLDEVLRLLDEAVEMDSASFILLDENKTPYLAAIRGIEQVEAVRSSIADQADKLIPRIWVKERTVYCPDVTQLDDWVHIPVTEYIRSWIGAVLFVKDRYIGILSLDHSQVDAYGLEDIQTVRAFADQAAMAIEYFRLIKETGVSNRRLQVLYDLNKKLAQTLDSREIIYRTLRIVNEALGGERADYYQYPEQGGAIQLLASVGREEGQKDVINQFLEAHENKSDVGWVLEHQTSISIPNVLESDLWIEFPEIDRDIRSLITVPVLIDGELSGAISILHSQEEAFTAEHGELLEAIAQQVGLALNNAQRYREVSRLLNMLEAHQQLQDRLFEHLPVGVLLLNEHYRILSANRQGLEIVTRLQPNFDYQQVRSLGDYPIQEIIPFAESGRPLQIKQSPGSRSTYRVNIQRVHTAAAPYWVLMINDVTSELETERIVQMQQRLATLGQFAAGITHDFNNIISAILVYADILDRDPDLNAENASRVNVIQEQSRRAAELINQILDFSRQAGGKKEPLDLIPFLERTEKLLARVLSDQIPIALTLPEKAERMRIRGDETGLQQMLMNLALNARDAMPEGGELEIFLREYHLEPYQDPPVPGMNSGSWMLLGVIDQGSGIKEEEIPRIFEPFYTTKESGEGTGLGLSQVYGIVKQHDGFIEVRSREGEGTSFLLYFPAEKGEASSTADDPGGEELDGRGQLVLVVEDDPSLQKALWNFLEDSNYQVISASDGRKGWEIFQQVGARVALVISDVVMPKMGGGEMVRRVRADYPRTPVIFITGHQDQLVEQGLVPGQGIEVLDKPFSLQDLVDVIRRIERKTPRVPGDERG